MIRILWDGLGIGVQSDNADEAFGAASVSICKTNYEKRMNLFP